jgi:hypothetical protein
MAAESLHKFARIGGIRSGCALQEVRWWKSIPYLWKGAFGKDARD